MGNQLKEKDFISISKIQISFLYYVRYLMKKIALLISCSLIGAFVGYVIAIKTPTKFEASTTFIIEDSKSSSNGLGGLASLAGQFGVDFGSGNGESFLSGDNILIYFKSPTLAREVLLTNYDNSSNKSIADVYAEVYKLKDNWRNRFNGENIDFHNLISEKKSSRRCDSLLKVLSSNIIENHFEINKPDKKAGIIEVRVLMEDEQLAKKYCETIVNKAVEKYISIKTQRQSSTVEKLQDRLDSISNILNKKTYKVADLQLANNIMDINPVYKTQTSVDIEKSSRDKLLLSTIFSSVTQNLEAAKFALSQETPVIQIIDYPFLPLTKNQLSKLKSSIIGFSTGFFIVSLYLIITLYINNMFIDQAKK